MNRLVIHPGTPQTWEIQLKPGANSLGRHDTNDFTINDPSVSGSHCHILVGEDAVVVKDIGSTNGTFLAGSRIEEGQLEHGKNIRLGSVEMVFYSAANVTAPAVDLPVPPPVMRIARPAALAVAAAAPTPEAGIPVLDINEIDPALLTGTKFCKHHPGSPARYFCYKCQRLFCSLCVQLTNEGGTCRTCGVALFPFQFWQPPAKSFYAKLPEAFLYPLKGAGVMILIFATMAFSALNFVSHGITGIIVRTGLYGFIFLFMQNIILTTTTNEKETLGFPDVSSLLGAALQLFGTVAASFWLAIGLVIAKYNDVEIPVEAIIGAVILGGIYFPMALLVVAMKDSVLAANPLIVIPAMLKEPWKYSVTVILLLGVFGIRQIGDLISSGAGAMALRTHNTHTFMAAMAVQAALALVSVYLLTVTMRILGLFYNGAKQKLGWFNF